MVMNGSERLPRHVAIIMDGNGRWAERQGLPRAVGHARGADAVRAVVRAARERGLECLTLYAFSAQNWRRPAAETEGLMQLLGRYLVEERDELLRRDIRLTAIGALHTLPPSVRQLLEALQRDSADNQGMTLCLALSYGGREALVEATRLIVEAVQAGDLPAERIDESTLSAALATHTLPPPDLVIRTSGEKRLSNFLLWEIAYAELYFTERLWPDFGRADLDEALRAYAQRDRRFGALPDERVAPARLRRGS
jgi:undecaprenyl diphosphate synthase